MNELIEKNISWDLVRRYASGEPEAEIEDAFIEKETGALTVVIGLNFVVPAQDEKRLRLAIAKVLPQARGARIRYDYRTKEMALTEDGTAVLFAQRLLAEDVPAGRHVVDPDEVSVQDGTVVFRSFGRMMTDQLNKQSAGQMQQKLYDTFGIERPIYFENDEAGYSAAEEKLRSNPANEADWMTEQYADALEPCWTEEEEGTVVVIPDGPDGADLPQAQAPVRAAGPEKTAAPKKTGRRPSSRKADSGEDWSGFHILTGRTIRGKVTPIHAVMEDTEAVIRGWVFHVESKELKKDRCLVTMLLTDKKGSTCVKMFLKQEVWKNISKELSEGSFIAAEGRIEFDKWEKALVMTAKNLALGEPPIRQDTWPGQRRVELHCHTKMSDMDAINDPAEIVKTAARWGQPAVAITDHGVVQAFPDAASAAAKLAKKGQQIQVIFGMEGYLMDDTDCIREDGSIDFQETSGTVGTLGRNTAHLVTLGSQVDGKAR